MIDLAKVRNYYIACGYTDLRLGIDGLAAVVTQQYGSYLDIVFSGGKVMATPQQKTTYSAAEVAALEETILKLKVKGGGLLSAYIAIGMWLAMG